MNGRVVDALHRAFTLAFDNVAPTDARLLVAVDVSGSMACDHCSGAQALTCAEGATALALVTARAAPGAILKAFSGHLVDLPISPEQRIDDAMRAADQITYGPTDCSLPMRWALRERVPVDAFVVLTDNETWFGHEHPCDALERYRRALGIDARLVVVAMTGTEFSIADPEDPRTLDVVGFDTATPRVLADFVAGGAVAGPA
ncbi:MAG: hypothetical protein AAGB93_03070 [Planctomycetota bacterium]